MYSDITSMCVHTVVILMRVHSGNYQYMCAHSDNTNLRAHSDITSACVHTVVILVRVHSDITSMCVHTVVVLVRVRTQW